MLDSGLPIAQTASGRSRPRWTDYAIALAAAGAALAVRWALDPLVGTLYPYHTLFPAIAVAVYVGGFRPAFIAFFCGGLAAHYFFAPPRLGLGFESVSDFVAFISYVVAGLLIALFGEALRSAKLRSEQVATMLAERARLLDLSNDAILVRDTRDAIVYWNRGAEALYGWTQAEAVGKVSHALLQTKLPESSEAILAELLHRGHWEGELRHTRRDGTEIVTYSRWALDRDAQGRFRAVLEINSDITERQQIEEMLKSQAKHLDKLVQERTAKLQETIAELEGVSYSITHDLRAPLRSMQGFARLLAEDCAESVSPLGEDYIRRITAAAGRMDRLIQDVLNYSRILRTGLHLIPVDVRKLLRGILETYPQFHATEAEIRLEGDFPRVEANEAALTQCFSNLLSNALKFVAPGRQPKVRIWAETKDSRVRLWFEDNGIGIEREYWERIFGMFQRLNRDYEGTGVGLAIVRKAAARMGGEVGVESEPGKGSRFWLELRRAERIA